MVEFFFLILMYVQRKSNADVWIERFCCQWEALTPLDGDVGHGGREGGEGRGGRDREESANHSHQSELAHKECQKATLADSSEKS